MSKFGVMVMGPAGAGKVKEIRSDLTVIEADHAISGFRQRFVLL